MIFPSLWINHMYIYVYVYHIKTPHAHPQLPDAKSGCISNRHACISLWCVRYLDLSDIHMHIHIYIVYHTYIYVYIYIYLCVYVCVCVLVQLYMCAYVRMLKILKPSMYWKYIANELYWICIVSGLGVIKEKQIYIYIGLPLVIYTQQLKTRIWNL